MKKLIKIVFVLALALSLIYVNKKEVSAKGVDDFVSIAYNEVGSGYKKKYGVSPWCASFVSWAAKEGGVSNAIPSNSSTKALYSAVKSKGGKVVSSPQKGDLVFYKHSNGSGICHVAIMKTSTMSIHGNYSSKVKYIAANNYYDSNGKKTTSSRMIFVRPNYNASQQSTTTEQETNKPVSKPVEKPKTSIKNFTVKGLPKEVDYSGQAIKPEITLYNGSKKISSSSYKITYTNNTNPGTATIKLTGKGNYTGSITKTFKILEADTSKLDTLKTTVPTDLSVYTDETVKVLNDLLTKINQSKTLTQKQVDAFVKELQNKLDTLVLKGADYTLVDEAIALIPEDLNPYTDESVEALNNAKNAVVRDYTILQQDKVNEMATNINNAIQALEKKPPVLQIALGSTGLLGIIALIIGKRREPKKMI